MPKSKCLVKNKQGKCAKNITIIGREWYRRGYGGTYQTVEVNVDGEFVGKSEEEGGYGDYYIQMALKVLQKEGLVKETGVHAPSGADMDYINFIDDMREHPKKYYKQKFEVSRERDL